MAAQFLAEIAKGQIWPLKYMYIHLYIHSYIHIQPAVSLSDTSPTTYFPSENYFPKIAN